MFEQAVAAFVQEAQEILSELEDLMLGLEHEQDQATIDAIFRGLHTIKGSGSMFGYTCLARFTHHFENAYELVRSGDLQPGKDLIDLSLAAQDKMSEFLTLGGDGPRAESLLVSPETCALLDKLTALTGDQTTAPAGAEPPPKRTPHPRKSVRLKLYSPHCQMRCAMACAQIFWSKNFWNLALAASGSTPLRCPLWTRWTRPSPI